MLNEEYHVDNVTGIVMCRNTQSRRIYIQQLGRILSSDEDASSKIVFVFPERIDRVATSFIQGFFDEIMMQSGLEGIRVKVFFETSIPSFKEFVIINLE